MKLSQVSRGMPVRINFAEDPDHHGKEGIVCEIDDGRSDGGGRWPAAKVRLDGAAPRRLDWWYVAYLEPGTNKGVGT